MMADDRKRMAMGIGAHDYWKEREKCRESENKRGNSERMEWHQPKRKLL